MWGATLKRRDPPVANPGRLPRLPGVFDTMHDGVPLSRNRDGGRCFGSRSPAPPAVSGHDRSCQKKRRKTLQSNMWTTWCTVCRMVCACVGLCGLLCLEADRDVRVLQHNGISVSCVWEEQNKVIGE